jgi:hypothetical protein
MSRNGATWIHLPSLGAHGNTFTVSVKTFDELEQTFIDDKLAKGEELRMVELLLGREGVPYQPLTLISYLRDKYQRAGMRG